MKKGPETSYSAGRSIWDFLSSEGVTWLFDLASVTFCVRLFVLRRCKPLLRMQAAALITHTWVSTRAAPTHPGSTLDRPSTTAARITASADPTILPRRRYLTPAFGAHLTRPSQFPLLHGMVLLMLSLCHWRASRDGLRLSASAEAESSFEKGSSTASRAVITIEAGSSTILGTDSLPLRAALLFPLYGACLCVHNCSASQPALLLLLLPRLRRMPVQCY